MSVNMPSIKLSREELIAALEKRRAWARRMDRDSLREHLVAEKKAFKDFQAACREALRWSYETAKDKYFSVDDRNIRVPSCPTSIEQRLDEVLAPIKLSKQATYTVSNDGPTRHVYWLLTHDENAKKDVCV